MNLSDRFSDDSQHGIYLSGEQEHSFDEFIHRKGKILRTTLEILASEIVERLRLRKVNFERIYADELALYEMIRRINYRAHDISDRSTLYQQLFEFKKERREQDVECWKDLVLVVRDFLVAFEAHENATAKARLINA